MATTKKTTKEGKNAGIKTKGAGLHTKVGKIGPEGKKIKGLGIAEKILAKFQARKERNARPKVDMPPAQLLAMQQLNLKKEDLDQKGTLSAELKERIASMPVGFKRLLLTPELCRLVGHDLASGASIEVVAKRHNLEISAVKKYANEYVMPIIQQKLKETFQYESIPVGEQANYSMHTNVGDHASMPVNNASMHTNVGSNASMVKVELNDAARAKAWEESAKNASEFGVYKQAYMTRAALSAKQAASQGIDEAAVEQLNQIVQDRATETVGEVFKVLAYRKRRRDNWMDKAFEDGKLNSLAGLSSDELNDLKLMVALSGLETAIKAEEKSAEDVGSQQTTNVMMVRMDGIEPSHTSIASIQPYQHTGDNPTSMVSTHTKLSKLFPLDVQAGQLSERVKPVKDGGMVIEYIPSKED